MMKGWQHTSAFVIQFLIETDIETGRFEGRVEHVASCLAMRFKSLEELLAFLNRTLKEARANQQEADLKASCAREPE
jgi:hypothetical protein